jgi:hypothetical protein
MSNEGKVEMANTLFAATFSRISRSYDEHVRDRFVVVARLDAPHAGIQIMDLWRTTMIDDYPYEAPWFVEARFQDVDHAVGHCVLLLCNQE